MTAARFLIAATAVLGCGVLVMSCGTAERASTTGAPVAAAPPPMELKPLLIDPTLANVRSALAHPGSSYPVRLEALRQARRLRDPRLAPLV
nr:hypothetical protein [Planctomycetota bacterium]